jgi:hypothetical protein
MLGFLTVLEHEQHGLTGGYLLLTTSGRPLEFHCTAPVKPSRAQQILFGPTLAPYLYGEHIGQTLVSKGSSPPLILLTDVAPVLAVGQFVESPVVLVLARAGSEGVGEPAGLHHQTVGQNHLAMPCGINRDEVAAQLESLVDFDCLEPFGRIREAIEEAQRGSSAKAA